MNSPAVTIGPTWQRDKRGFIMPELSLGPQVIEWCWKNLLIPDGERGGEPWKFTKEQARFIMWWYAVDKSGRFLYRRGTLRRMKGAGKDPLGAVISAVEFVGPCRVGGWREGQPLAVPHRAGWVQIAAVSLDQTRTTMTLFPSLFTRDCIDEHSIDIGKEIIYANRGARRIEALTTSSRTQEGPRPSFAIGNETHHWLKSNDGHTMRQTINRNLAKVGGRFLALTNAHQPGEDSVAERDYLSWLDIEAGKSRATGVLYDSLEAPGDVVMSDIDSLRAGLRAAQGDAFWLDLDRLIEEIYDPETPPSVSRRFYLNQVVAAEDAWVSPQEWDALEDKTHEVPPKAQITLGLDGSLTGDHTALIGCEVETEHLFTLGIWDPERYPDKEIPRRVVDAAVEHAFATYDVVGFLSDVHLWETYIEKWEEEHGDTLCVRATERKPIAYDMRGHREDTVRSIEAFHDAIVEGALSHDGHPLFRQHVHNARNRPWTSGTKIGMEFGKESPNSPRKIDSAAAAMLARKAMQAYKALPESKRRVTSNGWIVV